MSKYDIECPYCGEGQDICHDDGAGFTEDELHEQYCGDCDKVFTFYTSILYYYEAFKADCLNDGKHIWEETNTIPKKYSRMQCKTCEEEKLLSKDRLAEILKEMENE